MKTLFHLLLYRPNGSKTWTPYACPDRQSGNFFTSAKAALNYARIQSAKGPRVWLMGAQKWETLEFKAAPVQIDSLEPDWPPKNYRHPPQKQA